MDKLKMETPDLTQSNIEKLAALFPACVTEAQGEDGKLKKAVNFELLRQILSDVVLEGDEAYEFTWVGKKAAIVEANRPIRKTLRPCPAESVDWDTTENLYIEGDNLEVLKLLQESYLGKVKMIYIDPPYNTGNDFIYRDDFKQSGEEFEEQMGLFDEETGDRLFRNTDSNGRFHSDWCSMIYSRLMLARNMLTDDGVIFISIDDNEVENLKEICSEVFGAENFIASIIWRKNYAPKSSAKHFSVDHDYILVYAKNANIWRPRLLPRTDKQNSMYSNPDNDPRGPWRPNNLSARNYYSLGTYSIKCPGGRVIQGPPSGRYWIYSEEKFWALDKDGRIYWGKDGNNIPAPKTYLSEVKQGIVPQTFWSYEEVGHTQEAKKELLATIDFSRSEDVFDTPKPTRLIKKILQIATMPNTNDIVLDFFSGSATTAHAVMQLNAEDSGNRRFIMVQIPEATESKDYSTLCEIGKKRIRRAGKKILQSVTSGAGNSKGEGFGCGMPTTAEEREQITKNVIDIGFRVFKLADTNMTDVYYSAGEYDQSMLDQLVSNIKPDRTDLDLLFGCLLEWGLPLSMPYTSEEIEGCTVHTYNDGDLIACFDENIPDAVIKEIAKRQPLRAVFQDSSFADSPAKINVGEIFKMLAPDTRVKVL
jgi:adenine-specific DNA-methyltransferase